MRVDREHATRLVVTLHPHELAALVAAARWAVAEGPPGIPAEAVDQLREVLTSYERAVGRLSSGTG